MAVPLLLSDALGAGASRKKGSLHHGERTPTTKPVAAPENDALTPMKVHLPSKAPAGQWHDEGYTLFGNSPFGSTASTLSGALLHNSERSPGAESEGRTLPVTSPTLPTSLFGSFGGLISDPSDLDSISLEPSKVFGGGARWAANESAGLSPLAVGAKRSPTTTPIEPLYAMARPPLPVSAAAPAAAPAAPPPGLELPISRPSLDRPVPVLPSIGSENHSVGACRPCAWFWKDVGCQNGQSCNYCHLCDEGALKAKKKSKHTMKRLGLATPTTTTPLPSNQAKFALSLSSLI